jgi:cytochrome c oxidase assembly protein subunit 15
MGRNHNFFEKVALATVIATIFLIFVGGLVRASGAGLGCPDWPKCFGLWIPPLDVSELPAAFDASLFNVQKTWTEYINRLIGVVIGLLITTTFVSSIRYFNQKKSVTFSAAFAFLAVLFQAWLGGQVVRTGLSEGLITIHMLVAMLILLSLLFAYVQSRKDSFVPLPIKYQHKRVLFGLSISLIVFTLMQVLLGTQVREAVDLVSDHLSFGNGAQWLEDIGHIDEIHRSSSWSLVLISLYLTYYIFKKMDHADILLKRMVLSVDSIIFFQILLGIVLYYGGMPKSFQVLHLTFSAVMMCIISLQTLLLSNIKISE